jgi:hypothetical protein
MVKKLTGAFPLNFGFKMQRKIRFDLMRRACIITDENKSERAAAQRIVPFLM